MRVTELQGSITGKLTKEGEEFVSEILNPPRRVVMSLSAAGMELMREFKPGEVVSFTIGDSEFEDSRKYKIKRRDWKRCKVYMLEVRDA